MPDDFTTADFEYIEGGSDTDSLENVNANIQRQTRYTDFNPYAWGDGDETFVTMKNDEHEEFHTSHQQHTKHERRKLRKNSSGRRRLDRHNQGGHHTVLKREINRNDDNVYYVQSTDMTSSLHDNVGGGGGGGGEIVDESDNHKEVKNGEKQIENNDDKQTQTQSPSTYNRKGETQKFDSSTDDDDSNQSHYYISNRKFIEQEISDEREAVGGTDIRRGANNHTSARVAMAENGDQPAVAHNRVKRKSGKTTGALSRPKGASDSGSKSTSRKKDGKYFF